MSLTLATTAYGYFCRYVQDGQMKASKVVFDAMPLEAARKIVAERFAGCTVYDGRIYSRPGLTHHVGF